MKTIRIALALAFLLAGSPTVAGDLNCEGLLLADGSAEEQRCAYVHVAPATFALTGGRLRVTWPEVWEVKEAWIAEDWQPVTRYVPGDSVRLTIDDTKMRYDVVGWARHRETGETLRILTPVCQRSNSAAKCTGELSSGAVERAADAASTGAELSPDAVEAARPAPDAVELSDLPSAAGACSHTETADCGNGTKASVTCAGDFRCSGSHLDGPQGSATCSATSARSTIDGTLTTREIEATTVTESCVKKPSKPRTAK